jgi:spermidine synthase
MRVLSIVQWHHFAWMVISLALLGYGASGSFIALARRWLESRFEKAFSTAALMFSFSMPVCLYLGQRVPFNALEVVWNPAQLLHLAMLYLLFIVPFFFAATCIGLAFTSRSAVLEKIYFSDLLGAGIGAMAVIGALFALQPGSVALLLTAAALLASVLAGWRLRFRMLETAQFSWLLLLIVAFARTGGLSLEISEFKGLSQALEVVGSQVVAEASGPLGLLTVVDSPRVPFRHAPGLSFNSPYLPPEQLAVFTDGDGMSVINRYTGKPDSVAFLGETTAALPYVLLDRPSVLVLGAGAGSDVLLALQQGAGRVDAVELNPQMTALVADQFSEFAGAPYSDPRVTLHAGEARGFAARSRTRYDLVHIGLMDSFGVAGSGIQALNENYLYTVEAVKRYLGLLEPGGMLAITRWLRVPPRDSLKLAATVIEALQQRGADAPGMHLAMVRSWNTFTLLVRNGVFSQEETHAIAAFADERFFDTVHYPSMPANRANRFNRLERPWFHEGVEALLGRDAETFIDRYKFQISPAVDDRPYFFNFFKWTVLPEVLALRERGGAGLIEWGYLVLVATLVQALVGGSLLILLPLALAARYWPGGNALRWSGYFFLLGLAFLFIEMAFIQKFILFLSHPLYSVTVVLAGFLVFAGLGSAGAGKLARRAPLWPAVAGISFIALAYTLLLPPLFASLVGLPDAYKAGISIALIAPLAFCMGMPFPVGLRRVAGSAPAFIPWAWGINGFASVLGAAAATILAIHLGFTAVLLAAVACYLAAAAMLGR